MNTVERIFDIAKEKHIPISRIERLCGFSNGYLGGLRKGFVPEDRLIKIAEVLDVSADYLRSGVINEGYYMDSSVATMAQELAKSPGRRTLFDMTRGVSEDRMNRICRMVEVFLDDNNENSEDS